MTELLTGIRLYRIYEHISTHQDARTPLGIETPGNVLRLLKLSEEVGEVAQAYIGVTGANKRKGITHTGRDVAKELCDVAITALVALHDWSATPWEDFDAMVQNVANRCEVEGS